MDITLVAGGALEGTALDGGDVTLVFPGGGVVVAGDYVLVWGGHDRPVSDTARQAAISTSGYTQIFTEANDLQLTFGVWLKKMGSTPDTQVVGVGGGDASEGVTYCAYIFHGVDPTTPQDAAPVHVNGSSTNPNPAQIDTATANAWVVPCTISSLNDASVTAPSGYTNQIDILADDTRNSTTGGATKAIASPGTENPANWTGWGNSRWRCVTVALRPATAGAFSLDLGSGSYVLSGVALTTLANRMLTLAPGTYAITGSTLTPSLGRFLILDPGSYAVSGVALTPLADRMLTLVPGTYALTGLPTFLLADRILVLAPGAYAITGIDADLVFAAGGGAFSLDLEPGVYAITGATASVLADRILDANPGSYAILGVDATLDFSGTPASAPANYIIIARRLGRRG